LVGWDLTVLLTQTLFFKKQCDTHTRGSLADYVVKYCNFVTASFIQQLKRSVKLI